jgi:hypothetical protein
MNFVKSVNMQTRIAVGISLPKEIIQKIDMERGDVCRSRYLLRMLEKLDMKNKYPKKRFVNSENNSRDSLDLGLTNPSSSESQIQ